MAVSRGFWRGLLDRLTGWSLGLPSESCGYTITPVRIPTRDGIELAADLYLPTLSPESKASGQLLVHSPYGRGPSVAVGHAGIWAARNYQVLFVSCRGTSGSGGHLDPGRVETADSQDIVTWMRKQSWYPGTFATIGASYLTFTQWALLHDPPADHIGAVISVGTHDFGLQNWGTGAFRLDRIAWCDMVMDQQDPGMSWRARMMRLLTAPRRLRPVMESLPLLQGVETYFGGKAPWLTRMINNPDLSSEYYKPMQHAEALDRVKGPVWITSGWYDLCLTQTMDQYARLRERGVDVELTIGPWDHIPAAGTKAMPEIFQWLEEHVARRIERHKQQPVRVYVTGVNEWRDLPSWPPATRPKWLYLQPGEILSNNEPDAAYASSSFTYDPENPTPTTGGPIMRKGGRVNDSLLAARPDVLAFTTEPLDNDVEILGKPSVELAHSSDNPHADVFVRLSEVDAGGRSYNITETYKRLDPGRQPGLVKLQLSDCAIRVMKGNRIRLIVAGGNFPMFARNLGTDESLGTGVTVRTVTHTVAHGDGGISSLILPVGV